LENWQAWFSHPDRKKETRQEVDAYLGAHHCAGFTY
jgi:hypothetical protein